MASYSVLAEGSYSELLSILEWFSHFSLIPTLIGGWAVFVYNSYFGSVDVDLVGPSMSGNFLDAIERYERAHGYEEVRSAGLGIEVAYRKPMFSGNKFFGYVEIDVCTFEADVGSFHEDSSKELPYKLCDDPHLVRKVNFNGKSVAYVPKKPLLFLYKLKAFRDRNYDLKTRGAIMGVKRREWMRTKVEKDGADLIALLNPEPEQYVVKEEFDFQLLKQLGEKHDLSFALGSVKELPDRKKVLERLVGIEQKTVEQWAKTFFKKLAR